MVLIFSNVYSCFPLPAQRKALLAGGAWTMSRFHFEYRRHHLRAPGWAAEAIRRQTAALRPENSRSRSGPAAERRSRTANGAASRHTLKGLEKCRGQGSHALTGFRFRQGKQQSRQACQNQNRRQKPDCRANSLVLQWTPSQPG